jgi:hypothetical protein
VISESFFLGCDCNAHLPSLKTSVIFSCDSDLVATKQAWDKSQIDKEGGISGFSMELSSCLTPAIAYFQTSFMEKHTCPFWFKILLCAGFSVICS